MNEINVRKMVDDIFGLNSLFCGIDPFGDSVHNFIDSIQKNGFRGVIKRPHNLKMIKDKDGNVTSQVIEVVTTPFAKEDVKLRIKNDILTVECGSENKVDETNEDVIYRGISSQSYSFSLKIPETIDKAKIKAENKDGILRIDMPVMKEKKEPEEIEIKID